MTFLQWLTYWYNEEGPFKASPTSAGENDGIITSGDPIPVEPDGGIGDGAGPIPDTFENIISGGGQGSKGNDLFEATSEEDTFVFASGQGADAITGFDVKQDILDLSQTDLTNVKDVIAAASNTVDHIPVFKPLGDGIILKTGDGAYGYIEGITLADLEKINIIFADI